MPGTPENPGPVGTYTLDWENPTDRKAIEPRPDNQLTTPPYWYSRSYSHSRQILLATAPAPVRAGSASARFNLRRKDYEPLDGSKRAELYAKPEPEGAERWYGFSIFLPAPEFRWTLVKLPKWMNTPKWKVPGWLVSPTQRLISARIVRVPIPWLYDPGWETDPSSGEGLIQWHADRSKLSTPPDSPPLMIETKNGRWNIVEKNWTGSYTKPPTDVGAYELGRWTDWIVHARWSGAFKDPYGLLEIWKNDVRVFRCTGKNTYDYPGQGTAAIYLKFGIYKWDWKNKPQSSITQERTMFHDELRIAEGPGRYYDVAPPTVCRYGGRIKLKHFLTHMTLHSHPFFYGPGSSGGQQVTAFGGSDDNDYWIVKERHANAGATVRGRPLQDGDVIRLEHWLTKKNLHSTPGWPAPLTGHLGQQRVSAFGVPGSDDTLGDMSDDWRVEVEGGGMWSAAKRVRLIHVKTNYALHSHSGYSHPEQTRGQQEVTAFPGRDYNDWWILSEILLDQPN